MTNNIFSGLLILLQLTLQHSPAVHGTLICENGATFDGDRYECICTPHYHGRLCEMSFAHSDPCSNSALVAELTDGNATHRLGNAQLCRSSSHYPCIDFSSIHQGWYRLVSPAGNYLISQCPTGSVNCGSSSPFILADEVAEDNANRILSKARAYRYRSGLVSGCYFSSDTSYSVRILKCSASVTLYYMQPLSSSTHHYCIGDKKPCDVGLTSIDGSGFEPCINGSLCFPQLVKDAASPALRLEYHIKSNGLYRAAFYCNVLLPIFNAPVSVEMRYQVQFELTYRNGSTVLIPGCKKQNEIISDGHNRTFECSSEHVLTKGSNVYGGSLVCRVQAKCSTNGSEYSPHSVTSNSHHFFFNYRFSNGTDVIKPGKPVSLCIDSRNIPVFDLVTFSISVGRQQIILNDRIDVAVIRRDGNDSLECGFSMRNSAFEKKTICQDMVLYNHDPENRVPLGLTRAEQTSVIKVNISFQSWADGLNTVFENGTAYHERIQNIHLKVDLTSLQTNVTTYMHTYTDPYVKAAIKSYTSTFGLQPPRGQKFSYHTAIRHKLLPYEIQMKIQRTSNRSMSYVTEVAIRYWYYIIHIYGSSSSNTIQSPVVTPKLPSGISRNLIPLKSDGLPQGVTVENAGHAMRVRFDLYGTILYVWGFQTGFNSCSKFITSNKDMSKSCNGTPLPFGPRIVLELSLVPGFYDTQSLADGVIYGRGKNMHEITDPRKLLFSSEYQMESTKESLFRMEPTEILDICECKSRDKKTTNCFVSMGEPRREKREAPKSQPPIPLAPSRPLQSELAASKTITKQEADAFCNKFVELQLSKSVSTDICSATKDPTGEADYISQFKVICSQYASTLGTYEFSQSLFNTMLGLCYTDLTYNATVVLNNSTKIEILVENICPSNCSSRGHCINGECRCNDGFWGGSCEMTIAQRDEQPINVTLLQKEILCPSDNCSAVYLRLSPFVKSADSVCNIEIDSSISFKASSEYITGDIVKCDLRRQHLWLVSKVRMFASLRIKLTASHWESSNSVSLLLHQSTCGGSPVTCDGQAMVCRSGASVRGWQPEGADYGCSPSIPTSSVSIGVSCGLPLWAGVFSSVAVFALIDKAR